MIHCDNDYVRCLRATSGCRNCCCCCCCCTFCPVVDSKWGMLQIATPKSHHRGAVLCSVVDAIRRFFVCFFKGVGGAHNFCLHLQFMSQNAALRSNNQPSLAVSHWNRLKWTLSLVLEWSVKVEFRLVQEIMAGKQILFIYLFKQVWWADSVPNHRKLSEF